MKPKLSALGLLFVGCLLSPEGSAQAVHYAGKVVDETGQGIPAVTVQLDGSPASVQTAADGGFDIAVTLTAQVQPRPAPFAAQVSAPARFTGSGLAFAAPGPSLHRGDGRALAFPALPESPVTAGSPLGKPSTPSSAAPAAAYVLTLSKAGYITRKVSQTRASVLNLTLTLGKRPDSAGGYPAEKKLCLDETNRFRATLGLPAVAWSAALEAYAEAGVRYDAARNAAHAHFKAVKPNPSDAENEIPGWPLSNYKTVAAVVKGGIQMMWDEGPGGGHYENIKGSHTALGCGIFVTETGNVWVIQDFK